MPILTLRFKKDEKKIGEYPIQQGMSLSIGRLDDNDVVIENLAVSGHHAKVDSVGDKYLITDLNSKNGTFVNEQPILQPHWLQHGETIIIGKHYLVFHYHEAEKPPEEEDPMQQTMVMDTENYRKMMEKSAASSKAKETGEPLGVLSILSGGEGEIELVKKLTKIGKNASSDIIVSGLTIGQTAATISKRPNGYHLSYVGGMSKPKINGKTVKESVLLNQFDTIEIGSLKMQFIHKN
ncbi:FHA domain-containing protein [Desulfobacterales bacterium HSG17]|nr:FHA domain-containing protein [Desulfobacterales bacterium HSG17]